MAKILTITLNPAIDITVQLDSLRVGEVNRQQTAQSHAAGKGLNVAQVLKDLGHELIVSGFLGLDNRQVFEQHFQTQQFDNQFVYVAGETRQNIKIAEQSGRMTDINGKGFWVDATAKQQLKNQLTQLLDQVEVIVVAGSLPQGFSAQELQQLIEWLQQQGKKVAVDTSGAALEAAIAANPWLIKPNTDELTETYARAADTVEQQQQLFNDLPNMQIEHIVVSMGEHGVNWLHPQHPLHASAPRVSVQSTVGAGDSLVAGMIHGLVNHASAEETLKTATAIASHAVTQIGFHVPNLDVIDALKQQIVINSLS
ncbi:1-phosphofructokinase [Acinetobacter sp. MD2(2019)]|uniref:1-phosphofructokinase n=1 Tax=Acinetobacter sp. MD2(2019) TaxID=2605273 RepID=UPI002D1ECA29|nr:1-phosphofructokinase [Acinetobacter sp. MD2(2019)]MEB3754447.1 1-phosphofructokinase [Acinetobacter sp. MD2(2019)]